VQTLLFLSFILDAETILIFFCMRSKWQIIFLFPVTTKTFFFKSSKGLVIACIWHEAWFWYDGFILYQWIPQGLLGSIHQKDKKKIFTTCYDHDDRSHRLRNSYMLALSAIDRGSRPCRVKPNTIKLVFVASPLSTQH
jgi:hypothetical protein